MEPQDVVGFENYTEELIYVLRGLFAAGAIDSRPIKYLGTAIWLDGHQRIHRKNLPAVERQEGPCEYWEDGIKKDRTKPWPH